MSAPVPTRWRVLHLEDSPIDAELVLAHLGGGELDCDVKLVETQAAFAVALAGEAFDIILADYQVPDSNGLSALVIARELPPGTPFIFVSGTLGEETAVEAMRIGATDYVLKQRLARLPVAVARALAEARLREEQRQALAALREGEERNRLILESARDYAIFTTDLEGVVTSWNTGAQRILGYRADEILGRRMEIIFIPEDRDSGRPAAEMAEALRSGGASDDRWHQRRDGSRFWATGATMPLRGEGGAVRGFLKILRDRTEARRAEERRAVLIGELNHRVKNTLASVQSLAEQTLRSSPGPEEFVPAFQARLLALSRAHDLLTRESWEGATLRDTAGVALAPWLDGARRITMDGPAVRLAPREALALAMGLQELATNAAKHGALSRPGGRVALRWEVRGTELALDWVESDGPPVQPPSRRGFGSRLLGRALAAELRGTVELRFDPQGAACRIRFPPEDGPDLAATPHGDLRDAKALPA